MDNDSIIADLYKRGYSGARANMYDDGIAWTITGFGRVVRVSVSWGDDAADSISATLHRHGLPVPASFTRPFQPEWLSRQSAKDLTNA